MTIDERLEALTRNLELLSLESEKHDRQLDRAAKLVTEVAEGTARLLRGVEMHEHRLDSYDDRLDKLEEEKRRSSLASGPRQTKEPVPTWNGARLTSCSLT